MSVRTNNSGSPDVMPGGKVFTTDLHTEMNAFDSLPAPLQTWLREAPINFAAARFVEVWPTLAARGITPEQALEAFRAQWRVDGPQGSQAIDLAYPRLREFLTK